MVTVGPATLERFPRFSLYNSPYAAHDEGCAIDLYPHDGDWRHDDGPRETDAPSPVAGEVVATRTVSAPSKPYAAERDYLVVLDAGDHLARILHVAPAVEPGESVAVGDSLGEMVRSGFFAPWVDNHVHLGFRPLDANPYRASGSLPVEVDPSVELASVPWDGRGTVVARGDSYVVLDAPDHPAPGRRFAGVAVDGGDGETRDGSGILDGGLPHYEGGGVVPGNDAAASEIDASEGDASADDANGDAASEGDANWADAPVTLAGQRVGSIEVGDSAHSRAVAWDDVTVRANGTPITGLSLFAARDALGAKLVCPDAEFEVGEDVTVGVE